MVTLSSFALAALLILIWLWLRHRMITVVHARCERRPRLNEEVPPSDERGDFRQRYTDLSLKQQNKRDSRINATAGLPLRW